MAVSVSREHGTQRGFKQHQYRNELACRPCLDAHAAYKRVRYRVAGGRDRLRRVQIGMWGGCVRGLGWPR